MDSAFNSMKRVNGGPAGFRSACRNTEGKRKIPFKLLIYAVSQAGLRYAGGIKGEIRNCDGNERRGKSTAMRMLEDSGFSAWDNLPVPLIEVHGTAHDAQ